MLKYVPLLVIAVACGGSTPSSPEASAPKERALTLASYTTPREAYTQAVLPAFAEAHKKKSGETVTFEATYQASGAQARAVVGGLQADVVALSLDPDVQAVADAGLITGDWRQSPHQGIVTTSLVVFAVRPGNPKNIKDWADLARADVEVLTPNVRTSGGAMWNVLGLYGAALRGHAGTPAGDEAAATDLLGKVLKRVSVMDKGARESMVSFEKGVGDVAITYENEVIGAQLAGKQVEIVVPKSTILIENPVSVVHGYADKRGTTELAKAFVAFLFEPAAQEAFVRFGLRPAGGGAVPGRADPADVFTVRDLGGWDAVKTKVFAAEGLYDRAMATK